MDHILPPTEEDQAAANLRHYRRRSDLEYGQGAIDAYTFLHGLMMEADMRGLPVENVFERTEQGDYQSIVFPAILELPWRAVLKDSGFEFVPRIVGYKGNDDFWDALIKGGTMK